MTIISRIKKIESALASQPTGAALFREPPSDADDSVHSAFGAEVRKMLESGIKVIIVRNGDDQLRHPGVIYVPNDFEGQLELAAGTPDAAHGDKLKAILAKCRNTSLPVFQDVDGDE